MKQLQMEGLRYEESRELGQWCGCGCMRHVMWAAAADELCLCIADTTMLEQTSL